ncbi:DNA-binding PucR family transcriptional regulator [Geodermatophilus normandii]|uniref:DNA-binding PucR family transcriptional regulator n=1 Tax=Geodermatophilus normandii TaxID=1137989 RepID=A0A317QN85_9ACTN|nr:helix-turn-helix domain-containing protein [Geodermatophilus normandii]PWW24181.1 DNA-binding PucR family transcriptional regulator [Geodermatophilus normandii]
MWGAWPPAVEDWADAVATVAAQLLLEVPRLTEELVAELLARFDDDLVRDRQETAALEASVTDNLHTMFRMLAHRVPSAGLTLPPSALAWPRRLAHDGVSPHALQPIYYVGHQLIWRRWVFPRLAAAGLPAAELARAVEHAESELFDYLDRAAQRVLAEYEDELAAPGPGGPRAREQAVLGLLAGQVPTDREVAELGYPVSSTHQAVVVWRDSRVPQGVSALHPTSVAERLCRRLGRRYLLLDRGPNETWGWVEVQGEGASAPGPVLGLGDVGDVHVAIGQAAHGVAGFRVTHEDAGRVQVAVARARRPAPTITHYTEIALVTLLTADQAAAADYVRRQLGGLAADGAETARLRQTLRVFLGSGGSHARTADELGIHRNTVRYRVQRAGQLLGRPVQHAGSELHNALLITEWLARPGA